MLKLKFIVIATLACSALYAQTEELPKPKLVGKVVLKDKDKKDLNITADSKLEITLNTAAALDKLVLKNQYKITLKAGEQEVNYDVELLQNKSKRPDYVGKKTDNEQAFGIQCHTKHTFEAPASATYEKGSVSCIKSNCKSYVLDTDKKFKHMDSLLCTGKREAQVSKENAKSVETIFCKLADDSADQTANAKNTYTFNFQRKTESKNKFVKSTTGDCI